MPYSPKDGEVWDQRLWGVAPTYFDPGSESRPRDKYAFFSGRWYCMEYSPENRRWVGFEVSNPRIIERLKPL